MSKEEMLDDLEEAKKKVKEEDDNDDIETKDSDDDEDDDDEEDDKEDEKDVKEESKESYEIIARESVAKMFEGQTDLSEDFTKKAETIFEAALLVKVQEQTEKLEEQFEARLQEAEDNMMEAVNKYMSAAVQEWINENEIALQSSLKSEIAESFINDLKDLFEAHNINVPEDKLDLLEDANRRLEELESNVNKLTESLLEKNDEVLKLEKNIAFAEMTKDLSELQKEKFGKLLEGVEAESIEKFVEKAETIKETYFSENKREPEVEKVDEKPLEESKKKTNDLMSLYLKNAKETSKNR